MSNSVKKKSASKEIGFVWFCVLLLAAIEQKLGMCDSIYTFLQICQVSMGIITSVSLYIGFWKDKKRDFFQKFSLFFMIALFIMGLVVPFALMILGII